MLRFGYRLDRAAILRGLSALLGMAGVTAEDGVRVNAALSWNRAGLDFADALHLASSIGGAAIRHLRRKNGAPCPRDHTHRSRGDSTA